jgi:peptide/nickel transport system substrate-binding protein
MASAAGLDALNGPRDAGKVRDAIKAAGYNGEKAVVLIPSDFPTLKSMAEVGADMLGRCGFTVEVQYTDWRTMVQRLSRIDASGGGGWKSHDLTES